ncbi:hypothetical protein FM107_01370 [Sphingobacterium sp. JB170]|nr:hypothetical protein FM107_01370 [Sphingobacterium sp. JB170]
MRFYKFLVLTLFVFSLTFSSAAYKVAEPKVDNLEQHVTLNKESATLTMGGELVLKSEFDSTATPKRTGVVRILAIRNSFSRDAIETYLYELAEKEGIPIVIGNLYIGGASLDLHWKNANGNKAVYQYRKIAQNGSKTNTPATSIAAALADEP